MARSAALPGPGVEVGVGIGLGLGLGVGVGEGNVLLCLQQHLQLLRLQLLGLDELLELPLLRLLGEGGA